MRGFVYKIWSALPARVFAILGWLVALYATILPGKAKEWLDWLMTPEQMRFWSLIGLVIFSAYWVIFLILKPKGESSSGGEGVIQSSSGPYSSNNSAARDMYNYYGVDPLSDSAAPGKESKSQKTAEKGGKVDIKITDSTFRGANVFMKHDGKKGDTVDIQGSEFRDIGQFADITGEGSFNISNTLIEGRGGGTAIRIGRKDSEDQKD